MPQVTFPGELHPQPVNSYASIESEPVREMTQEEVDVVLRMAQQSLDQTMAHAAIEAAQQERLANFMAWTAIVGLLLLGFALYLND